MDGYINKSEFLTSRVHCKGLTLEGFEAVVDHLENFYPTVNVDEVCDEYKKEAEKYKRKYEIAKSGLTKEERSILLELLINEQIKHLIPKNKYESDKYKSLEELKAKIRVM